MKKSRLAITLMVHVGLIWSSAQANFIAPADGPVAFRRDQLPLDSDAIVDLARHLEIMARASELSTSAARRHAAQLLALASALNPANKAPRELLLDFQLGNHTPLTDKRQLVESHAAIWRITEWLESAAAGKSAHALAACLLDVMLQAEPDHLRAKGLRVAGEQGAWQEWVPTVAAYDVEELPVLENQNPQEPSNPQPESADIPLHAAKVSTALWIEKTKESTALGTAILEMNARRILPGTEKNFDFQITICAEADNSEMAETAISLKHLLEKQHGPLPRGWQVSIAGDDLKQSLATNKPQFISAAVAVLANAALTGREPDATILGVVNEDGAFVISPNFWNQLNALTKNDGKRLILPMAAAEFLPAMLALEKPQFFFQNEVVLAANFKELCDLSVKKLDEKASVSSAKFQEIRSKLATQAVGSYVANPYIQRRLEDLGRLAPNHASARMLAIQGAGKRPAVVPKKVMLEELKNTVNSVGWLIRQRQLFWRPVFPANLAKIDEVYEKQRLKLIQLERVADKTEQPILIKTQEMLALFRPIQRALRSHGNDYAAAVMLDTANNNLVTAHSTIADEISTSLGLSED